MFVFKTKFSAAVGEEIRSNLTTNTVLETLKLSFFLSFTEVAEKSVTDFRQWETGFNIVVAHERMRTSSTCIKEFYESLLSCFFIIDS